MDFPVAIEPVRPMSSIFDIARDFVPQIDRSKSIPLENNEGRFNGSIANPQLFSRECHGSFQLLSKGMDS